MPAFPERRPHLLVLLCLLLSWIAFAEVQADGAILAKVYPGTPGWPTQSDWQALNATLSGGLIKFIHPYSICSNISVFNRDGCANYQSNIQNASWIGENPALTNWPQFAMGSESKYPSYIAKVKSAKDVSTAIKWAAERNVRVVIKNTGHDFLGRNVGYGALSIWTKHIQGIEWLDKWNGTTNRTDISGKWKGAAVRYGSGHTWGEVRAVASKRKHLVVTGAEGTVGAGGGWLMGGGHGPYSNTFGLGVEQVLEFEIVTPTGDILITNEQSHPDLFWALRGGGGSTYGVVTRVTYKSYPEPNLSFLYLKITPKSKSPADQENFYKALAYMLTVHVKMADSDISGYPMINQTNYLGLYVAPERSFLDLYNFLRPVSMRLAQEGVSYQYIPVGQYVVNAISWFGSLAGQDPFGDAMSDTAEPSGFTFAMGSRLLSRRALIESNIPAIVTMLKTTLEDDDTFLLPYSNMPGIQHAGRPWDFGLNPAWRTAAIHIIAVWNRGVRRRTIGSIIPLRTAVDDEMIKVRQMQRAIAERWTPALDALSENHAAYINEGSPYEQDWKTTFFGGGENYERLLGVKRKYDPNNVLWCSPCVGTDVFREGEDGKLYRA